MTAAWRRYYESELRAAQERQEAAERRIREGRGSVVDHGDRRRATLRIVALKMKLSGSDSY